MSDKRLYVQFKEEPGFDIRLKSGTCAKLMKKEHASLRASLLDGAKFEIALDEEMKLLVLTYRNEDKIGADSVLFLLDAGREFEGFELFVVLANGKVFAVDAHCSPEEVVAVVRPHITSDRFIVPDNDNIHTGGSPPPPAPLV